MSPRSRLSKCLPLGVLCAAGILASSNPALAQALSATFDLTGVTFVTQTVNGQPPIFTNTFVGTGQFIWDYTAGNFSSGTGTLVFLKFPITPDTPGGIDTVTLNGIDGTLPSNVNLDNHSYDYAINFASGLTGSTQSTHITGGSFDLTGSDGFSNGEYIGSVTGGSVTPQAASEPSSATAFLIGFGLLGVIGITARRQHQH